LPAAGGRIVPVRTFAALCVVEVIVIAIAFGGCQYARGVPAVQPAALVSSHEVAAATADPLRWPSKGQAAVAVEGLPPLLGPGANGTAVPIASVAKVMTALLILERHPLAPGESGPTLTITASDEARYAQAVAQDQSVVDVRQGETISEYQLLQGLLLASGNNIAEILASWDAGSTGAFVAAMNDRGKALGMTATLFDDVSGFSSKSVSNAADLLLLGQAAMEDRVFREIVAQREAELPIAGILKSTNVLLEDPRVIGIKTGNTDEAGGCMLFAAIIRVRDRDLRMVGVVLGQGGLGVAFEQSRRLIEAMPAQIVSTPVVTKGEAIAVYRPAWGGAATAGAADSVELLTWAGARIKVSVDLAKLSAPAKAGAAAGQLTVEAGGGPVTVPIQLQQDLDEPGLRWRLVRD
jgi:D-alanyl-D-alanine carboxypeptidase (penicillin-binding protein 5/6)